MGWNPSDHPRYPNGKFRPKLSQSVRVSPISVSYNAGVRVPIVPGKANLYLGALARIERAGRSGGLFQRQIDKGVNKVFGKIGDPGGRSNIALLLKGQDINTKGGLRVTGPRNVINTPTFRVSSTAASRRKGAQLRQVAMKRPARRRTRSAPITGMQTARPRAITKGPRRVRKSSARGRRLR